MEDAVRYEEALALSKEALSDDPRGSLQFTGYACTLGDIAAHLVACASIRRRDGRIAPAVKRLTEAGRRAIAQLSILTSDPAPEAQHPPVGTQLAGIVGKQWTLHSGYLSHYGRTWRLSGRDRRIYAELPHEEADYETLLPAWRRALKEVGLPGEVVSGARVGVMDRLLAPSLDRPWTAFEVPMPDRRMDYVECIVDAAHQSPVLIGNSLASYARQAHEVYVNRDQIRRQMNAASDICMAAMDEVEGLVFEGVRIYRAHVERDGLKNRITFHAMFWGLSEALREVPVRAILSGEIGLSRPEHSDVPRMVETQKRRYRALKRIGGTTIDATGLAFMKAAGHGTEKLETELARDVVNVESNAERLHAGYDTNAWFRIDGGRITAAVDLDENVRWKHDRLEIRKQLPEAVIATLPGRSATDVLQHPALQGAVIRNAFMKNGRLSVVMEPRWEKLP